MGVGPARIQPQQHARPVLRLGSPGAGVDFDEGVVGVSFAGEQGLKLLFGGLSLQLQDLRLGFGDGFLIALFFAQLDQVAAILQLGAQAAIALDRSFEPLPLLHRLAGVVRVIPEVGILGQRRQFVEPA